MPNLTTRALTDMRAVNEAARLWPNGSVVEDTATAIARHAFMKGVRWALDSPAQEAIRRESVERKRAAADRAWGKR